MGITREISPELEPIEFPDSMDEAAVDAYVQNNGQQLRAKLISRRQAQLARETDEDEALKAAMGQVPFAERVGSTLMSAPQSAMRQTGQTMRGLGEFLATTPIPREPGEIAPEIVRENIRRAQRTPEQIEQEVEADPIRQVGTRMVAAAPETFPTLPGVRESFPSQVASGVGSVAALLPSGLAGPMAPVVGGAMYGLSAGEESADDAARVIDERIATALAQGDTATAADLERRKFDIKNTARTAGRVIGGATEGVLGVAGKIRIGKGTIGGIGSRVAERLVPRGASQLVQNRVRGAIEGGLTEATQESTEQLLGNAAAMAVYDPNRGLMDDVVESGIVGGVSGKVIGGVAGSRGGPRDPMPASRQAAREVTPTLTPEDTESPDLTIEDVGDVFGGKPVVDTAPDISPDISERPAPEVTVAAEVPAETVADISADIPVSETQPAEVVAEVAPPTPEPAVTQEKPKRTRKPKPAPNAIEAAIPATPAPEPATPPQAKAAPATIPPDDAAMEAATAAVNATGQPAPVTRAPDAGIAERIAADTAMEQATARAGQPQSQAPLNVAPEEGVVGVPKRKSLRESVADTMDENGNPTRGGDYYSGVFKQASDADLEDLRVALTDDDRLKPAGRRLGDVLAAEIRSRKPVDPVAPAPAKPVKGRKAKASTWTGKKAQVPKMWEGNTYGYLNGTGGEYSLKPVKMVPIGDVVSSEFDTYVKGTEELQAAIQSDPDKIPPIVVERNPEGKLEVVDGEHRFGAASVLGLSEIPVREAVNKVAEARRRKAKPAPIAPAAEPPAAQAKEVTTPEAAKQSLPPMAPKAQKAFLLEKIDEAIAEAPEQGQGKVVIEVPGDGTFTVANNQEALREFKKRAKRFPDSKAASTDPTLPSKSQSKPTPIGKNTKESFLASAKEFVSDDPARETLQFVISDGKRSVATNGRAMLVWNQSIGGSSNQQGLFDTTGKERKNDQNWRIPAWQQVVPKTAKVIFKKLNTERLFGLVKQATAGPTKIFEGKNKKPSDVRNWVRIVRNPDGSMGMFATSQFGEYVHNVQKDAERVATVDADLLMPIIQASRRMGSEDVSLSIDEEQSNKPVIIKWDGAEAMIMPIQEESAPESLASLISGEKQSDILERALNAAIKATDRASATFSDPFLIAAVGLPVLNAALRLTRRVYLKTRNLVRAKQQGMRLIRRRLRTDPAADIPRIEEAYNRLVDGTPEQAPPDEIERFQAADGTTRQKSRGRFVGDVTVDTDAEWQAGADRWINQFNGNIRRAFEAAKSTDYATTGLNPAAQTYVFGRLLELSETAINAARNDVDAMRNLNLQKEIADAIRQQTSESGKSLSAANLVQNRTLWMNPVLSYRNLIREAQKRLPFPDITADEVRTWLQESGRKAVQEMRNAMTDADKVFAREFKTTARDMRVVWRDVMTASAESQENIRRKILEELVKQPELAGMSREGFIDIANLLGRAWERERAKIFAAEFRKQVPLPSVKEDVRRKLFTAIPDILKWANLGLLDNEAFRNAVAPKFGVAKFNGETAKKLNVMAQQAQKVGGVNRNRILAEMYELMQTEGGVRWPDIVRDYWYAAVLGAVNTQVDNALGVINGALNTVMGVAMAKPEVRRLMGKAYVDGFSEAISDFWPILWRGDIGRAINYNPNQPANALAAISKSGNIFAKALGVGKYVSRLMTALDQINALSTDQAMKAWALGERLPVEHVRRYLTPSEKVLASARLKAESEGTPPNLMRKRVREIVQETIPVEVLISSKDIRELVTFTNQPKGIMGAVYRGVQEMEKKAPGFKLLSGTNFLRFAANYTNEILNYVAPVALWRYYQSAPSRSEGSLGLKMGKEERQLILAKMALGTALGTFAAALFLGDDDDEKHRAIDITGSFKSLDPNKRKQLLSEGRQPYSIRFGNTYVSYRQLPFGGVLGSIGELRDRQLYNPKEWNEESIARKFADGAFAGSLIVRDSPAISSFTEFLGTANAYKYDMTETVEKSMPRYMARLAGSFIPRFAKEVDAWSDPSIYKANTGHEFFLQQMPFFRRELGDGPVLNVLGEPVRVERFPYSRWIRTRQEDKAWSTLGELASKGVFLPVPSVTVKVLEDGRRRPLTPSEQYRYQQNVGRAYRKFVEENSSRLLKMKPDEATDFIDRETDRIRQRIRAGA